MKNKFNFSRRNPKTKKIENTGFMEFRNVSNNAADLYIYGDIVSQHGKHGAMKIHARRTYQTL